MRLSSNYGVISTEVMRDASLSLQARALYGVLATYAYGNEVVWPSLGNLGEALGVSRATVKRLLAELSRAGVVVLEEATGRASRRRLQDADYVRRGLISEPSDGSSVSPLMAHPRHPEEGREKKHERSTKYVSARGADQGKDQPVSAYDDILDGEPIREAPRLRRGEDDSEVGLLPSAPRRTLREVRGTSVSASIDHFKNCALSAGGMSIYAAVDAPMLAGALSLRRKQQGWTSQVERDLIDTFFRSQVTRTRLTSPGTKSLVKAFLHWIKTPAHTMPALQAAGLVQDSWSESRELPPEQISLRQAMAETIANRKKSA